MKTFSTQFIEARHRSAYWNDAVCSHCALADHSMQGVPEEFMATFTARHIAGLELCEMSSSPHVWNRTQRHVRQFSSDDFLLAAMHNGTGVLQQNQREAILGPGDFVLYDTASTFDFQLNPGSIVLMKIPRQQILERAPMAEELTALNLAPNSSIGSVFFSLLQQIKEVDFATLDDNTRPHIANSLLDMLAAALLLYQPLEAQQRSSLDKLYAAACAYLEKNLGDPELNLQQLSMSLHSSPRSIARAFAHHANTPMRWLWLKRLEHSHQALQRHTNGTITQIALESGFSDMAHFSRAFKRHFGYSPSHLLAK
ncbi:AraC family transcriptional regulator [Alcaligenes endophyticus]|uniref:AraC family transcriptional regulator n=1 Tax=Alcaligenes endophyticus TaxID=1929088 RepID=A0ABT8EMH5_9BURK|nr:AraC family transcriptional regulator [Alcaligenes endophyticus]MCX5590965.1 AraC family transcriptional regulator [Alcaligenes endophyticus]MDN4122458.1 AraC family transcriptional regulator [Alcaligenes endophyticus]